MSKTGRQGKTWYQGDGGVRAYVFPDHEGVRDFPVTFPPSGAFVVVEPVDDCPPFESDGAVAMHENEFKVIYHESGRNLYNFILWITGNRGVCDDILQEVFIKIWRCEASPPDPDERRRWLLTITRNACLDFFRKSNRFARFRTKYKEEWYEPPVDPDAPFIWNELQQLAEVERSILFLHLKIGHSYREIADMLELTENLVRVKAFRALKKLKETLVKKES